MTPPELRDSVLHHLKYSLGKDAAHAVIRDWRMALSLAIRDRITDPWFDATRAAYAGQHKRVYYLSMEFLIGRLLQDAIVNLGLLDTAAAAFDDLGLPLESVVADEPDAALGNGGLGRLAACFIESLSSLAARDGIRHPLRTRAVQAELRDGRQIERARRLAASAHAWEFERPESAFASGSAATSCEDGTAPPGSPRTR